MRHRRSFRVQCAPGACHISGGRLLRRPGRGSVGFLPYEMPRLSRGSIRPKGPALLRLADDVAELRAVRVGSAGAIRKPITRRTPQSPIRGTAAGRPRRRRSEARFGPSGTEGSADRPRKSRDYRRWCSLDWRPHTCLSASQRCAIRASSRRPLCLAWDGHNGEQRLIKRRVARVRRPPWASGAPDSIGSGVRPRDGSRYGSQYGRIGLGGSPMALSNPPLPAAEPWNSWIFPCRLMISASSR
jgi:hypothetical protein